MTNKDELLPCPFCGEKPLIRPQCPSIEGDAWTKITCDCRVEPSVTVYEDNTHFETAKHLWNTRAQPQNVEVVDIKNKTINHINSILMNGLTIHQGEALDIAFKYLSEKGYLSHPKPEPSGDVQLALDALDRMYNDALASQDGYGTSHDDFETIRAALTARQPDVNQELLDALKGIDAMIRQKKGFYAISVGHDPVKIAHKTGVNKGLDVVHQIVKQAIARAEKEGA